MNAATLLAEVWRTWRASLRKPGFVLLAGGTLALGVGASVAIFAMLYALLLRPLPFPDPSRLVVIGPTSGAGQWSAMSPVWYQHLGTLPGVVSVGTSMGWGQYVNVASSGEPIMAMAQPVDRGYLATLGVSMALGRNFTAEEDSPNGPPAVILSHGFWLRQFGGDRMVIGRSLMVNGKPRTVVGVLPDTFRSPIPMDLLLPLALPPHSRDPGTNLIVMGRLATGTSVAAASAQIDTRLHGFVASSGDSRYAHTHYSATSLATNMGSGFANILWMVFLCVLSVLLIAGGNVSNLMLLRAVAQSHNGSIRAALGASGLRMALPALAEGFLVATVGVVFGLGLAMIGLRWINAGLMRPDWFGTVTHVGLNAHAIAFAILAGWLVAGLAALLGVWRGRTQAAPRELVSGGRAGLSVSSGRLSRVLVVAQAALAASLLVVAALFAHSLLRLTQVDLGFDPNHVLMFTLTPPQTQYPNGAAASSLSRSVIDRLRSIPGVREVGLTSNPPIQSSLNIPFELPDGQTVNAQYRFVSPGEFAALGVPVLAGRDLGVNDRRGAEPVALVSAAFQNRYLNDRAIGQNLTINLSSIGLPPLQMRIVGVVGDIRQFGPQAPVPAMAYVPIDQVPDLLYAKLRQFVPLNFILRVAGNPTTFESPVRVALREVAPELAIANLHPLSVNVSAAIALFRMLISIIGLVAALALVLACVGLYSVMAVAVAARQREFGVRAALGGSPWRLMTLVLRGGLGQVALGLLIGICIALGVSGLLRAYLFGLSVLDPWALAAVCGVLALAGSMACLRPALRAGRVHPMEALRGD